MDRKLEAGLDAIRNRINTSTGLGHPNDLASTVELLRRLVEAGHIAQHPDEVTEYLRKAGVPDDAVSQITLVYETLALAANDPDGPWWKDDILDGL